VATYDVRENKITDILRIPGISGNPSLHTSGVQVDTRHDRLSIISDAGAAFDTNGQNIAGDNWAIQYDLHNKKFDWRVNLTALTNGVYGGFQDVDHDAAGNLYVVGTYPSSIIKISVDGKTARPWYLNPNSNHNIRGYTGIAAFDHGNSFLVSDNTGGKVVRFNAHDPQGKPFHVPLQKGAEPIGTTLDDIYIPTLFKGTIVLISDNNLGTIVIRSKDGVWATAEKLGVIPNMDEAQGGSQTATVEMGGRIYASTEWFGDSATKERSNFTLYDITDDIIKLL
jgi:hypothetical protein